MICAFANSTDLNQGISDLNVHDGSFARGSNHDGLLILKAEHYDEDSEENYFFYAMLLTREKVASMEDKRSISELIKHFPVVPKDTVEKVWANQNNWGSCFDVLSSLVASHQSFVMNDCEFLINRLYWPPLSCSNSKSMNSPLDSSNLDKEGSADCASSTAEWSVIEIESDLASLNLDNDLKNIVTERKANKSINHVQIKAGLAEEEEEDNGWELLSDEHNNSIDSDHLKHETHINSLAAAAKLIDTDDCILNTPDFNLVFGGDDYTGTEVMTTASVEAVISRSSSSKTMRNKSYRDVLQLSCAKATTAAAAVSINNHNIYDSFHKSQWRPAMIIVGAAISHKRKDRLYMDDEEVTRRRQIITSDDYDTDGEDTMNSFFTSSEFIKGRVAASRYRVTNLIRPAIMEKKLQRIAAKG